MGEIPEGRAPIPNWAELLVRGLDDLVRTPNNRFAVGLDAIIGFFVPAVGDAITAVGSVALLFLGVRRGVPTVVLGKMVLNIGIDALVGAIPLLGDIFDVFFRSNRRNLELIELYSAETGRKPSASDYLIVSLGLGFVLLALILPFLYLFLIAGGISSLSNS